MDARYATGNFQASAGGGGMNSMLTDSHRSIEKLECAPPPAIAVVETTLALVQELARKRFKQSGLSWQEFCMAGSVPGVSREDLAAIDARILSSGYRYAWSAAVSLAERPEAYQTESGALEPDHGISHPQAPQEAPDAAGRALRGVGDNVVRYEHNLTGVVRYIRTNAQVLALLQDGVTDGLIAVIDDSGGTLTAPIIERFAGVICAGGTVRSHLGILTREYNIPCLMNAKIGGLRNGDRIEVETSAPAKTTEDYQQNRERVARIWLLNP